MAVVKMGQIKSTVVKALAYISRPDATSDGLWVSTNAAVIDPGDFKAVARQFAATAERVGVSKARKGSVLAHHVIQSFDPKEAMTVEQAHRIGVQFAERITGGQHEYTIATHLDKGHVHNHIIFNAVNMETGRKFRVVKSTIGRLRDLNDELSLAAGLTVLPKFERASGRTLADTFRVVKGVSAKEFLRTEIDKAAIRAQSWGEFEAILGRAGIEVSTRGGARTGTLSFREITMGRPVRDWRLGAAYTEESIMARLSRSVVNMIGVDVSLVLKETKDTITVVVPGTRRELTLTVAKTQIVRRERQLRIYVPSADKHLLASRSGGLGKTVDTAGLYQYFSQPEIDRAMRAPKVKQESVGVLHTWGESLNSLRELTERVNAKARWVDPLDANMAMAVLDAGAHVDRQREQFQSTLVAMTEALTAPKVDGELVRLLGAELRIVERDLEQTKTDVGALVRMNTNETRASLADRIEQKARELTAEINGEPTADAESLDEVPAVPGVTGWGLPRVPGTGPGAPSAEPKRGITDPGKGPDGGAVVPSTNEPTRTLSLAERIEQNAAAIRAAQEEERRQREGRQGPDDRGRGR